MKLHSLGKKKKKKTKQNKTNAIAPHEFERFVARACQLLLDMLLAFLGVLDKNEVETCP